MAARLTDRQKKKAGRQSAVIWIAGAAHQDAEAFVRWCVRTGNMHRFYTWSRWLRLRDEVLADDKHECQYCKARGQYKRAALVHHVNHVRKHPELALSRYYIDDEGQRKRQLISCCDACHGEQHPERIKIKRREPLTVERW